MRPWVWAGSLLAGHESAQGIGERVGLHPSLPGPLNRSVAGEEKEMGCLPESEPGLGLGVRGVRNVEVNKTHLVTPLPLEPMHDGRHGAADNSRFVKELQELGPAGGSNQIGR